MAEAPPHRIPDHELSRLRAENPLPALVARDVPLQRSGRGFRGLCPFHGERRPSFFVYADHFHCFGCGAHGDVLGWVMQREHLSFREAVARLGGGGDSPALKVAAPPPARPAPETDDAARRAAAITVFLGAQLSLAGTPAADYLAARGIDFGRLGRQPRALRFHPGLWEPSTRAPFPALVGAITSVSGETIGVHRTWLARGPDGRWGKARVANPKMSLGFVGGGAIRLWRGASGKPLRDAPDGETVVIGEGIETCLSIVVACPDLRVLSAVSLGNLGGVVLPEQVRRVILARDNDDKPTAQELFKRAVEKMQRTGREVLVARSSVGKDFNDCLRGDAA